MWKGIADEDGVALPLYSILKISRVDIMEKHREMSLAKVE